MPVDRADEASLKEMREWLAAADEKTSAAQIRQVIQHSSLGPELTLRALIKRYMEREHKTEEDRNKLDFLVVQYLAATAPPSLVTGKVDPEDVAYVLEPVLGELSLTLPRVLEPLKALVERIKACRSLRELIQQGVVESGRRLKESAGETYFGPSVLAAFARYNFLVRRAFVKLLHDDLESIRKGLKTLEEAGAATVNCSAAGFGETESIGDLRRYCHTWRNIFVADYASGPSFRSIAEVRTAVEESVRELRAKKHAEPVKAQEKPKATAPAAKPAVALQPAAAAAPTPVKPPSPAAPARTLSREVKEIEDARARVTAAVQKAAPVAKVAFTVEQAIESIGKQLVAAHATATTATATVKLGASMVVLSAWELNAFLKKDALSPLLQRAVAARAILIEALERGKRTGVTPEVAPAVQAAHAVVGELQKKIGEARDARNLDAAVNLAASSKRLLAITEEAEKSLGAAK